MPCSCCFSDSYIVFIVLFWTRNKPKHYEINVINFILSRHCSSSVRSLTFQFPLSFQYAFHSLRQSWHMPPDHCTSIMIPIYVYLTPITVSSFYILVKVSLPNARCSPLWHNGQSLSFLRSKSKTTPQFLQILILLTSFLSPGPIFVFNSMLWSLSVDCCIYPWWTLTSSNAGFSLSFLVLSFLNNLEM